MIDHTGLDISDPAASRRFYEAALAPLGYQVLMEVPVEFTGGAVVLGMGVAPKPDFWLHQGTPQTPPYKWWNWHDNYDAGPDQKWIEVSDAGEAAFRKEAKNA